MLTSLRSKILAGFAAIITVNVAFGLWSIYQFASVGQSTADLVAGMYELNAAAVQLETIIDRQYDLLVKMYPQSNRSTTSAAFDSATADVQSILAHLSNGTIAAGKENLVAEIRHDYETFRNSSNSYRYMLSGLFDGVPREQLIEVVQPLARTLKQNCRNLVGQQRAELNRVRNDLDLRVQRALIFVGAGTLAATVLGLLVAGFYTRWIVRPIARLTQAARNLAGGKLDQRILITTNDELGDLSFEFNRMIERLRSYEEMNIEQLLLEKRKVETIVQSIATPIIVVDASMRLLLVNPAALEFFRLSQRRDYEGEFLPDLVPDESIFPPFRRALEGGSSGGGPDVYIRGEKGKERFYTVAALPLATTSAVRGAVAVFTDITHFKELDRLKSDFLAKVSHEFRTPVTSIMMSVDILREGILGELNEAQLDLLASSKDDCRRLTKLITDLLELSRVESNAALRRASRIELASLAHDVLRPHTLPSRDKGVEIIEEISEEIPEIWGDPEEFRWVLNNLISNAVRHTESGGSVTLRAVRDGEELVISVQDTGEGIPLDGLGRIFERFQQIGSPSIATPGSVGLGLSIVKEVIERYGGSIAVESELGVGSCFSVRVPLMNLRSPSDIAGDQSEPKEPRDERTPS